MAAREPRWPAQEGATQVSKRRHFGGGKRLHGFRQQDVDVLRGAIAPPEATDEPVKRRAFEERLTNPDHYYYRHNAPGQEHKQGKWLHEEDLVLLAAMHQRDPLRDPMGQNWGLLSVHVPGRIGYQCSSRHSKLIKQHLLPGVDEPEARAAALASAYAQLNGGADAAVEAMDDAESLTSLSEGGAESEDTPLEPDVGVAAVQSTQHDPDVEVAVKPETGAAAAAGTSVKPEQGGGAKSKIKPVAGAAVAESSVKTEAESAADMGMATAAVFTGKPPLTLYEDSAAAVSAQLAPKVPKGGVKPETGAAVASDSNVKPEEGVTVAAGSSVKSEEGAAAGSKVKMEAVAPEAVASKVKPETGAAAAADNKVKNEERAVWAVGKQVKREAKVATVAGSSVKSERGAAAESKVMTETETAGAVPKKAKLEAGAALAKDEKVKPEEETVADSKVKRLVGAAAVDKAAKPGAAWVASAGSTRAPTNRAPVRARPQAANAASSGATLPVAVASGRAAPSAAVVNRESALTSLGEPIAAATAVLPGRDAVRAGLEGSATAVEVIDVDALCDV